MMAKGYTTARQKHRNVLPPLPLPLLVLLRTVTGLDGAEQAQADWKEQVALPSWPLPPIYEGSSL